MTKRRRVFHLITRFLNGGAETTTEHTLEALQSAERPYDLRLGFGAEFSVEHVQELESQGVETVCFRSLRHWNPLSAPVAVLAVARYLRENNIEILHTHSTEAGIVGRWAAALAGTPVVVHEIHGDPITADRNFLLNAFVERLERLSAPLTTRFVVKSERIRKDFLERGIGTPAQYNLIYHGVRTSDFSAATATNDPPKTAAVRLLFVGRLADGKGLFDLLDAVDELERDHDVELVVVGDGPLRNSLSEAVENRGLAETVTFTGYRDDIPALMASADGLVLPSYREGTPRVVTEALAAGLPVVATDIAGLPEQVDDGETGYLVDPGDVDALTDRLRRLVESPERRRRMGDAAQEAVERFDIETVRRTQQDFYDRLVDDVLDE